MIRRERFHSVDHKLSSIFVWFWPSVVNKVAESTILLNQEHFCVNKYKDILKFVKRFRIDTGWKA